MSFATSIKLDAAIAVFPWVTFKRGGTELRPSGWKAEYRDGTTGCSGPPHVVEDRTLTGLCSKLSTLAAQRAGIFAVESTHEPGSHSAQDPA